MGTTSDVSACSDVQPTIDQHNEYRTKHQAPNVRWSEELATAAQAWAKNLADRNCFLEHSANRVNAGENIFMQGSNSIDMTCAPSVRAWYSEVSRYNFTAAHPYQDNWPKYVGHFTQVVWKSTSQIGCGVAKKKLDSYDCKIVVCQYRAPGNYIYDDLFAANVLPPIS